MRKYLAKKSLKTIDKLLLFSKKKVSYSGNIDRRANNSNKPADRTDENLNDRIDKFEEVINGEKNTEFLEDTFATWEKKLSSQNKF